MNRSLTETELLTQLNLGRPIEVFLGNYLGDNETISWLSLERNQNTMILRQFDVYDEGVKDFIDIYSFSYVDPDNEFQEYEFDDFTTVAKFIQENYGLLEIPFLTKGQIETEYEKYRIGKLH